jgi:hypothetical protein
VKRAGHATLRAAATAVGILWSIAGPLAAQTSPLVARTASVTGAAAVITSNSGSSLGLSAGFLLNPGDRVDTRAGGRVVIDLSDGSMVVVEPQSVIVLKDFRQADSLRELFDIMLGKVRVQINHFAGRPNPYRMNSPTASIAVRGTQFSIEVRLSGDTRVMVFEGAVQVTSLSDASQTVLVEAGRGVLVQAGQDFHLIGAAGNTPALRPDGDRRAQDADGDLDQAANLAAVGPSNPSAGNSASAGRGDHDGIAPRATASAYDTYVSSLSDLAATPFLFRFNAFSETHLDSLENPAYATQFQIAEARVFVLPTIGGGSSPGGSQATFDPAGILPGNYSISPQISVFSPIRHSSFFAGGSFSTSRASDNAVTSSPDEDSATAGQTPSRTPTSGGSLSNFYSGSFLLARRFGSTSVGVEVESLRGTGSLSSTTTDTDTQTSVEQVLAASRVSQTRFTAGLSHDFGRTTKLGIFYDYGFISANDHDLSHTLNNVPIGLNATASTGHSSKIGFRFRGVINPRLFYGVTGGWLGVSLADDLARTNTVNSYESDRAQHGSMGLGIGYALSRRTILTFDTAAGASRVASSRLEDATGNLLQNGTANSHFFSGHTAVQVNLTRRLFVSASYLNVWHAQHLKVSLFPDQFGNTNLVQDSFFPLTPTAYQLASHFSDFGIGWRFSPEFFAQYLFTTDYGVTAPTHTIMLRYTIKLRRDE